MIDVSHDRDHGRPRNVVRGGAHFDGIEHDAFFKRNEISFCVEVFGDLLRHFLVERLVDCRQDAAVHQFSLEILCENTQFFRQILYRKTFGQSHFAKFTRRFRFRLWPDVRRFKLFFSLAFVALCTINALVHRRAALLGRRRRRHRGSARARPHTRSCRGAWRCSSALESRGGRMSWLSLWRTHRSLAGPIKRPSLAGRWRWGQTMLLAEPLLHNLLHGLPLFMRRLDSGRYGRTNSCWRWNDSPAARRGLDHRGGWLDLRRRNRRRGRDWRRRSNRRRRNLGCRCGSLFFDLRFRPGFDARWFDYHRHRL